VISPGVSQRMKVPIRFAIQCAAVLAAVCPGSILSGQTTPSASLLVLSKHDHTLSIVDPSTLQVVASMPVGEDPHEVIASTDGTTAYVSNYGSGAYNTLAVLDLVGHRALPSIDLGHFVARMDSPLSGARPGSLPKRPRPLDATTPPRRRSTGFSAPARIART
jgi:YVTN family beta-propeller protein